MEIYIENIDKLPDNWIEKTLYKKHSSKSYNPNMEPVFYLAGHIKVCIRGIEKISNSCKENNLLLLIYHINSGDIMVRFKASLD